jgi:hypothetical protein
LVLPAGALTSGHTYTFRVIASVFELRDPILVPPGALDVKVATDNDQNITPGGPSSYPVSSSLRLVASSSPSITIRTSLPPLSPLSTPLSISPSSGGIALSTQFTLALKGFTGELEPYRYSFKQITPDGTEISIGETLLASSTTIGYLPAGTITIVGYVTNRAGQRTRVTGNVTVIKDSILTPINSDPISPTVITNYVNNLTSTILDDQTSQDDQTAALALIRLLTDLLNASPLLTTDDANIAIRRELRSQFLQVCRTAFPICHSHIMTGSFTRMLAPK